MIRLDTIGHLGRDCVVRDVPNSNQKTISFSVAHSEKWRDAAGVLREKTTWVNCTIWRNADKAGIAQYLTKGTQVHVEGIPEARYYQANDGTHKAELSLRVKEITLLGSANRNDQQPAASQNQQQTNGGNNGYSQTVQQWQTAQQPSPQSSQGSATAGGVPPPPPDDLHVPDDLPF